MDFNNVLDAFKEYISESQYIDVLNTKFGYTILHFNPDTESFVYTPEIIRTPQDMLQYLKEEIVLDVLESTGRDHDLENADQDELNEIQKRTIQYTSRLVER